MRILLSIDDLPDGEVDSILAQTRKELTLGKTKAGGNRFSLGLLFLEDSLRTRVGFAEASLRLGGSHITLLGARNSEAMSSPESFEDTLRVLTGMVDLVVARAPFALGTDAIRSCSAAPLINGGDGGPVAEHPSQALIDLFAAAPDGDVTGLRIGVCGDLRSRAARSTLKLLARRHPRELRLICPRSRAPDHAQNLVYGTTMDVRDLDVLIMTGLPARRGDDFLDASERGAYVLTGQTLASLPTGCTILCPMPSIDEIGEDARKDARLRMFSQSDQGVAVRAALLRHVLLGP